MLEMWLLVALLAFLAAGIAYRASERERMLLASLENEAREGADAVIRTNAAWVERAANIRAEAAEVSSRQVQERVATWETAQRAQAVADAEARATVRFDAWKAEHEDAIRKDAVTRSTAVVRGNVTEQLAPFLEGFKYDPRDCRFVGAPIDLIVFDGLYGDGLRQIVFLEIKTGESGMNVRERAVRDAVRGKMVTWEQVRI